MGKLIALSCVIPDRNRTRTRRPPPAPRCLAWLIALNAIRMLRYEKTPVSRALWLCGGRCSGPLLSAVCCECAWAVWVVVEKVLTETLVELRPP